MFIGNRQERAEDDRVADLGDIGSAFVTVKLDFRRALEELQNTRLGDIEVGVKADTKKAKEEIVALGDEKVSVKVGADTKQAQQQMSLLDGSEVSLHVTADTKEAAAQLSLLDSFDVTAEVDADIKKARAKIESLDGTKVEIEADVDTKPVQRKLAGFFSKEGSRTGSLFTGGFSRSIGGFNFSKLFKRRFAIPAGVVLGIGALTPGVAGLSGAVAGLAGSFVQMSGAAASGASALGAVAQVVAVSKLLQLDDLKEALGGNKEAFDRLTPAARTFEKTLLRLGKPLRDIRAAVQETLFPKLTQAVKIATPAFESFLPSLVGTADALGNLAVKAAEGVNAFRGPISDILSFNNRLIESGGGVIGKFFSPLLKILRASQPLTLRIVAGFDRLADSFSAFIGGAERSGALNDFFTRSGDSLGLFVTLIGRLGKVLLQVFNSATPLGNSLLKLINDNLASLSKFLDLPSTKKSLAAFFASLTPSLLALGRLAKDLFLAIFKIGSQPEFAKFVEDVRTKLLPAVLSFIDIVTTSLGPKVIPLISSVLTLLGDLAKATGPVIAKFATGITNVANAIHRLFEEHPFLLKIVAGFAALSLAINGIKFATLLLNISGLGFAFKLAGAVIVDTVNLVIIPALARLGATAVGASVAGAFARFRASARLALIGPAGIAVAIAAVGAGIVALGFKLKDAIQEARQARKEAEEATKGAEKSEISALQRIAKARAAAFASGDAELVRRLDNARKSVTGELEKGTLANFFGLTDFSAKATAALAGPTRAAGAAGRALSGAGKQGQDAGDRGAKAFNRWRLGIAQSNATLDRTPAIARTVGGSLAAAEKAIGGTLRTARNSAEGLAVSSGRALRAVGAGLRNNLAGEAITKARERIVAISTVFRRMSQNLRLVAESLRLAAPLFPAIARLAGQVQAAFRGINSVLRILILRLFAFRLSFIFQFSSAVSSVANLLARVSLFSAGVRIMNTLLAGLRAGYVEVQEFIRGIAVWIKKNKGPVSADQKLLQPAGQAIMSGFDRGLRTRWSPVQAWVRDIGGFFKGAIAGSKFNDAIASILLGGGGGVKSLNAVLNKGLGVPGGVVGTGPLGFLHPTSGWADTLSMVNLIERLFGVGMTSGLRMGDTVPGPGVSQHVLGQAADFGDSRSSHATLTKLAVFASRLVGSIFKQVIWLDRLWSGGAPTNSFVGGHQDHVHLGWQPRAAGGRVEKGRGYRWNERGAEMFMPHQSGYIMNAGRTKELIGAIKGLASQKGGGTDNRQAQVHLHSNVVDPHALRRQMSANLGAVFSRA